MEINNVRHVSVFERPSNDTLRKEWVRRENAFSRGKLKVCLRNNFTEAYSSMGIQFLKNVCKGNLALDRETLPLKPKVLLG